MDPFTIVLLLMLGFAVLLVAGIGRRGRTGQWLPRLVAGAAIVLALLNVVAGIVGVVGAFAGETLTLRVPVIVSADLPPVNLRESSSEVVSGATQQATLLLTATGLDTATRALVAVEVVITTAIIVTLLVVVARLAQQSIAPEPFTPRLSRLLVIGGSALAIGSIGAQVAGQLAGQLAHEQLVALSVGAPDGGVTVPPTWTWDLLPIGVGLALIVIARLIRAGERLQSDTRGLV